MMLAISGATVRSRYFLHLMALVWHIAESATTIGITKRTGMNKEIKELIDRSEAEINKGKNIKYNTGHIHGLKNAALIYEETPLITLDEAFEFNQWRLRNKWSYFPFDDIRYIYINDDGTYIEKTPSDLFQEYQNCKK